MAAEVPPPDRRTAQEGRDFSADLLDLKSLMNLLLAQASVGFAHSD